MLQMGNKGAFIRFEAPDLKPNIVTFSAVVSIFYLLEYALLYHVLSLILHTQKNEYVLSLFYLTNFLVHYDCISFNLCYIGLTFFPCVWFILLNMQPHPDVKPMAYANNFLRMFS